MSRRWKPRIVAVHGRGTEAKTTLAELLHAAVPASAVVHTDDVAWHHSFSDWADLLVHGGRAGSHCTEAGRVPARLAGAVARGRDRGSGRRGPGDRGGRRAGRRELMDLLDVVLWVRSDLIEAERRGIARDGKGPARSGLLAGVDGRGDALLEDQRTWERATLIVAGTPTVPHDPTQIILAPALRLRCG